ncbi:MAG: putative dual-specificity RNA methyltransferase RlmN [Candidatus Uhrbacteria bacterium GW2011_GWE2_40_58]|nr:MAG: putative dual-specificity RNA methyltransferase RlmN [Candidatus Uhrbacteria bacterium GW2011_GWF2_40_263]KKR67805.1 MAG: putative dual-specificity RNA methyltransferase RlmN [Candidatus Uhrbacteria bacterium GW2011_GWE2_40_58]
MLTRLEQFDVLFPKEPAYRKQQLLDALFSPSLNSWNEATTFSKEKKDLLETRLPWISVKSDLLRKTSSGNVVKAVLQLQDGALIESVLMHNKRGQWTICLSTQVGCAMNCAFCATGKMGLVRQLSEDEIVDQYRFWASYLLKNNPEERISNLVFMGMGEPLMNYETVKSAINLLIRMTDIGPTKITVSTVGILPRLEQILTDTQWPDVRIAISLHSADAKIRQSIIPSSSPDFLKRLKSWARTYEEHLGNRRHHLTFEYIMLERVNDSEEEAQKLVSFLSHLERIKVNLIPYNNTRRDLSATQENQINQFMRILENAGITVTVRRSLGQDIDAACGQLSQKRKDRE